MTLPLLVTLAVVLILFYWVWIVAPGGSQSRREELLRSESLAWDAAFFPVDPRLMLGDWEGTCILFDPGARKACIVVRGKFSKTVDFDYFRIWQLKWTEYFGNPVLRYQHVHLHFETNDFDRPTICVDVSSKAYGEAWDAKLSILMP